MAISGVVQLITSLPENNLNSYCNGPLLRFRQPLVSWLPGVHCFRQYIWQLYGYKSWNITKIEIIFPYHIH